MTPLCAQRLSPACLVQEWSWRHFDTAAVFPRWKLRRLEFAVRNGPRSRCVKMLRFAPATSTAKGKRVQCMTGALTAEQRRWEGCARCVCASRGMLLELCVLGWHAGGGGGVLCGARTVWTNPQIHSPNHSRQRHVITPAPAPPALPAAAVVARLAGYAHAPCAGAMPSFCCDGTVWWCNRFELNCPSPTGAREALESGT